MQIALKLYGNLKLYAPDKRENALVEIKSGTTIRSLLLRLGVPDTQVWMSAINDQVVDDSSELYDGDVLEVFEPVGGGVAPSPFGETIAPETQRSGEVGARRRNRMA